MNLVITAIEVKPEHKEAFEKASQELRRIANECTGGGWEFINIQPIKIGEVVFLESWSENGRL